MTLKLAVTVGLLATLLAAYADAALVSYVCVSKPDKLAHHLYSFQMCN